MSKHEQQDELPPLLWIRDRGSEHELALMAPETSALRLVDSDAALAAIDAFRGNALLRFGLVVVESSSRNFNAICGALDSLDPAPRVIILYPKLRFLGSVFAPPEFASKRKGTAARA